MSPRRQLSIFAFLLAAAIVFHQQKLGNWEPVSLHSVVTLSALFVMLKPSSVPRLVAMLGIHLFSVVWDMPLVVNHWLLLGLAEAGLFVALAFGRATGREWARDAGAFYEALAPYLRIQVCLVYFFAALAKVNEGFLDADVSCGAAMLGHLLERAPVPFTGDWLDQPSIIGTIAIEFALPVVLAWRRTRLAAVFVGIGFHLTLALAGHLPFTGFAMAFYFLFMPDDMPERLDRVRAAFPPLDRTAAAIARVASSPLAFPVVAVAFLGTGWLIEHGPGDPVRSAVNRGAIGLMCLYAAGIAGLLALALWKGEGAPRFRPGVLRLAHPVWLLGPLLVTLNAISPYVGLKTQSTFTMYSNLQTEPGHWNHSLLPESMRVFGYQDELVEIEASSDRFLAEAAENDRQVVWFDLRRHLGSRPDASVTYVRDGRRFAVQRAGDDPRLSDAPALGKVFFFRDVPEAGNNGCRATERSGGPHQGS